MFLGMVASSQTICSTVDVWKVLVTRLTRINRIRDLAKKSARKFQRRSKRPMDDLRNYIQFSEAIPGWTRGEDAEELVRVSSSLGADAVIVEIGAFLGSSTVLLAGPRRLRGSGKVHVVDPFDCSGDAFSVPYYRQILQSIGGGSPRNHFEAYIREAGLIDWVEVHQGRANEIAASWMVPLDLLLLDGDQSPQGAREAYASWAPFLKSGGVIVLRNTQPREYAEGHDGHRRLALEEIVPPAYQEIRQVGATTFARKAAANSDWADARPAEPLLKKSKSRPSDTTAMCVHLYAQCWNDEFMLPFFFRHYDSFVDRYVIFDDGSTDRSLFILSNHPRVEVRRFERSDLNSFAVSEQALSNECWKESRGVANWVIVSDIDEQLFHPAMPRYLRECAAAGVSVIPALGFQMISNSVPCEGEVLFQTCPFGVPWAQMMKSSLFDPLRIEEINFSLGRHTAAPSGEIKLPSRDEVLLLHYKYLNLERTYLRHRELLKGLGSADLQNRWGHKYGWSLEELKKDWNDVLAAAVDVRGFLSDGAEPYPLDRWWKKFARAAATAEGGIENAALYSSSTG
jgi:predicted O-methyltransferase YrrM